MIVTKLVPSDDVPGPNGDPTIERSVRLVEGVNLGASHGVLLKIGALKIAVTQVKTDHGWAARVEAFTDLAEGNSPDPASPRYYIRSQGEQAGDEEHSLLWVARNESDTETPREVPDSGAIPYPREPLPF